MMITKEQKAEILDRAIVRLTPKENWTKHTMARQSDNAPVTPRQHNAKSWCMMGAIVVEIYGTLPPEPTFADFTVEQTILHAEAEIADDWVKWKGLSMSTINDSVFFTHEEMLDTLRKFRAHIIGTDE